MHGVFACQYDHVMEDAVVSCMLEALQLLQSPKSRPAATIELLCAPVLHTIRFCICMLSHHDLRARVARKCTLQTFSPGPLLPLLPVLSSHVCLFFGGGCGDRHNPTATALVATGTGQWELAVGTCCTAKCQQ